MLRGVDRGRRNEWARDAHRFSRAGITVSERDTRLEKLVETACDAAHRAGQPGRAEKSVPSRRTLTGRAGYQWRGSAANGRRLASEPTDHDNRK